MLSSPHEVIRASTLLQGSAGRRAASTCAAPASGQRGDFLNDFGYAATWDFGGTPGDRNRLYEA